MRVQPKIKLHASVLAKFIQFDLSRPNLESAGFLRGTYDEATNTLHIFDLLLGEQSATGAHVSINESALIEAISTFENDNLPIVGWIHSHPGLTAFFSGTDIQTHQFLQSLFPAAVGIVVDAVPLQKKRDISALDVKAFQVEGDTAVSVPFELVLDPPLLLDSNLLSSTPSALTASSPSQPASSVGSAAEPAASALSSSPTASVVPLTEDAKARIERITKAIDDLDQLAIVDENDRDLLLGLGRLLAITENSGTVIPSAVDDALKRIETRLEEALSNAEAAAWEVYDAEVSQAYLILFSILGFLNILIWLIRIVL